jgi:hypothetical protein
MSEKIKLYEWNLSTARRPRRIGMFRSLNYVELSVAFAVTSLVFWFSTNNVEVFLTIFGFAYLLAIAHAWRESNDRSKDNFYSQHSQLMDRVYELEDKCCKSSEDTCKTTITNKVDF